MVHDSLAYVVPGIDIDAADEAHQVAGLGARVRPVAVKVFSDQIKRHDDPVFQMRES